MFGLLYNPELKQKGETKTKHNKQQHLVENKIE